MPGVILCADIGTSSLKAAFIGFDGKLAAFSREPYQRGVHSRSIYTDEWERAFSRALHNLYAQFPACAPEAVCISGNGPTLAPVTVSGETLPPLYWHDGRIAPPETAGAPAPRSFFLPRAAWLKQHAPAEYEKTGVFLSPHEWLSHRLGAPPQAVLPSAAFEPYFWDDEQCRLFALDRGKFPPFATMGSVIGTVSAQAAHDFGAGGGGIKSGTPIVAGGTDFITALIGTGTLRPGDACDRAGSSEGINVCAAGADPGEVLAQSANAAARTGAGAGLRVLPHVREGLWNVGKVIPTSGSFFERYRAAVQETQGYAQQLDELLHSFKNNGMVMYDTSIFRNLPFLPISNEPFPHIANRADGIALGRQVLCAMGFAVKAAAGALGDSGFQIRQMRVSGGQAKNSQWNQLKADITGIELLIPKIPDGELAGNAVIAAVALGAASSLEQAADRMIHIQEVFQPRREAADFWNEQYALFQETNASEMNASQLETSVLSKK